MAKNRIHATITIDKDLWVRFRMKALKEGKTASKLIESFIARTVARGVKK